MNLWKAILAEIFLASWREVLSESKPVKRRIAITFSDSEKLFCCKIVSKAKSTLDISCQIQRNRTNQCAGNHWKQHNLR